MLRVLTYKINSNGRNVLIIENVILGGNKMKNLFNDVKCLFNILRIVPINSSEKDGEKCVRKMKLGN